MYFDENELNNMIEYYDCPSCTIILDCPVCKKKFNSPRTLPCGNVVCNGCVISVTKSISKHFQFRCSLCAEIHDLPKNGFPICHQFQNLLSPNNMGIGRGNTSVDALLKFHLKDIRKKMNDLNKLMDDGVDKIVEHCTNVRNEVKNATKIAFQTIKELSDTMIGQINKYEKECIGNELFLF